MEKALEENKTLEKLTLNNATSPRRCLAQALHCHNTVEKITEDVSRIGTKGQVD